MLQGRCLLPPWPRADVLRVAHPQAPGRGLPLSGHPSKLMQQGRDAHPIPGATLNPGWVQEGDRAERRRGAEPEKHHSGLHFITMATSWKLYRIRAPEHQIREAAAGRMLAPRGRTGSPGAWGWGEHGAWWPFPPPWVGAAWSAPSPVLLATLLPPSPSHQSQPCGTRKRLKFTSAKPSGTCCRTDAALCRALTRNLQRQKKHLSSVS